MSDQEIKIHRVREYLNRHGYSGMILARQDNFNWITSGGNNRVIIPKEEGFGTIVILLDKIYFVAQVMDGQRIMDEELQNFNAEYVPLHWFEESVNEKAISLAGNHPVGDMAGNGIDCRLRDIYDLHFPLLNSEIEHLKQLGKISDEILTKVAKEIKPGMIDYEVEAMLLYEYAKNNIQCDVLLIGTDDRIFNYKHPTPVGRKLGNYVFLHPAVRWKGLHCNVTRSIYFGDRLPSNIASAYDTVSQIEVYCMSQCKEGTKWSDIFQGQKRMLKQAGYETDWQNHYPGGRTGYFVSQADLSTDIDKKIVKNEAYDWFITVTGAKVEELGVNLDGVFTLCSHTGIWPGKKMRSEDFILEVPQIMMR